MCTSTLHVCKFVPAHSTATAQSSHQGRRLSGRHRQGSKPSMKHHKHDPLKSSWISAVVFPVQQPITLFIFFNWNVDFLRSKWWLPCQHATEWPWCLWSQSPVLCHHWRTCRTTLHYSVLWESAECGMETVSYGLGTQTWTHTCIHKQRHTHF